MKLNSHKGFRLIFVTSALGILGLLIGFLILSAIESGKFPLWKSLGKPPSKAIRFVGYKNNAPVDYGQERRTDIFIENSKKEVYRWNTQEKVWEKTDKPIDVLTFHCQEGLYDVNSGPNFLNLPYAVQDCIPVAWGVESFDWDIDVYVLLADGSIWKWHDNPLDQAITLLCGTPLITIVLGKSILSLLTKNKNRIGL